MKDFKIYLFIASAALTIYLVAQYNKPGLVNWKSTMIYQDKIPFGTYVLYHELGEVFPGASVSNTNQPTDRFLKMQGTAPSNYMMLANNITLNHDDYEALVKYIEAGNSVFMAAFEFEGYMADTLHIKVLAEYAKSNVGINFTSPGIRQAADYKFDKDISNQYFRKFDTTRATVLGKNELNHATFIRFNFGRGALYLCANPHIFTNYSLLSKKGADYAEKALSYMPVKPKVYWDEYQTIGDGQDRSPLRVFFSHESLQWAYYLSLAGLVIFVLYEIKRRQRIIPVIEPLKNTTLDFVNVVGQVYYEQRNNDNIATKKVTYFLEYLRARYYIKTNILNNEFMDTLAHKTGIELNFIQQLIGHINYLSVQPRTTDQELIILNQLIEQFYSKAGK